MTAARSYKKPLSIAAARTELTRCAGKQFDPAVVRALLNVSIPRVRRVLSPLAWIGQFPMVPSLAAVPAPGTIAATGAVVAGLAFGPIAVPVFDGHASAEAATATTAEPVATTQHAPSSQSGPDPEHAGLADATTGPTTVVPPASTVVPTPDHTRAIPDADPPTLPALPAGQDIDALAPPVVDDVVTPLVDDVVTPLGRRCRHAARRRCRHTARRRRIHPARRLIHPTNRSALANQSTDGFGTFRAVSRLSSCLVSAVAGALSHAFAVLQLRRCFRRRDGSSSRSHP